MNGILVTTITALLLSIFLVTLDSFLKKEDNKIEEIKNQLPGYNCGSCGFGSCEGMAKAITENGMNYLACKPMKAEKKKEFELYLKSQGLLK